MSSERTIGRTLKQLALALVNATLLLIVLALVLALVLTAQIRGIASDSRAGLQAEIAALRSELVETRAAIDQARSQPQPSAPGAIASPASPDAASLRDSLDALAQSLAQLDRTAPPSEASDDTFMRWFVLTFFSFVAERLFTDSPEPG